MPTKGNIQNDTLINPLISNSIRSSIILNLQNQQVHEEKLQNEFKLAENGNIKSMAYIGNQLITGEFFPKNVTKGIKYLTEAVHHNDPDAQNFLGLVYLNGQHVKPDFQKALSLFENSSQQGHPYALYNLSRMYYEGKGVPRDQKKGFQYLCQSIQKGNLSALPDLMEAYLYGKGTISNYRDAKNTFYQALQAGTMTTKGYHIFSQYILLDSTISDREQLEYIQKAIDGGYIDAYNTLALFYIYRDNIPLCRAANDKGIDLGSSECLAFRGKFKSFIPVNNKYIYEFNKEEALKDLQKAAEQGSKSADIHFAYYYLMNGNLEKSLEYCEKLIQKEEVAGNLYKGLIYKGELFRKYERNELTFENDEMVRNLLIAANHGELNAIYMMPEVCHIFQLFFDSIIFLEQMFEFQPDKLDLNIKIYEMYLRHEEILKSIDFNRLPDPKDLLEKTIKRIKYLTKDKLINELPVENEETFINYNDNSSDDEYSDDETKDDETKDDETKDDETKDDETKDDETTDGDFNVNDITINSLPNQSTHSFNIFNPERTINKTRNINSINDFKSNSGKTNKVETDKNKTEQNKAQENQIDKEKTNKSTLKKLSKLLKIELGLVRRFKMRYIKNAVQIHENMEKGQVPKYLHIVNSPFNNSHRSSFEAEYCYAIELLKFWDINGSTKRKAIKLLEKASKEIPLSYYILATEYLSGKDSNNLKALDALIKGVEHGLYFSFVQILSLFDSDKPEEKQKIMEIYKIACSKLYPYRQNALESFLRYFQIKEKEDPKYSEIIKDIQKELHEVQLSHPKSLDTEQPIIPNL